MACVPREREQRACQRRNSKDGFMAQPPPPFMTPMAAEGSQIIVIENTNNFSMTSILREKANVIEFTHKADEGRYGFLLDYRD